LLGYPEQALRRINEALGLTEQLSHPASRVFAHMWAARVHYYRGEGEAAYERVNGAIALATEHHFYRFTVMSPVLRGRLLVERGEEAEGLAQMQRGLSSGTLGGPLDSSLGQALLAESYRQLGQTAEGLTAIDEALKSTQETGRIYYDAELTRLRGELLLSQTPAAATEAEQSFHEALAMARRQAAKSLELRAAMSLARLWQQQGKQAAAHELLSGVYGWFTEGFDTADLRLARALLQELS